MDENKLREILSTAETMPSKGNTKVEQYAVKHKKITEQIVEYYREKRDKKLNQDNNVISEADIKYFRKYLIDLGKHLGDRRLVQSAEKASSSKLKQMYDKDLHYKEFSDKEVTKYNIKKLHISPFY